jgi:hypothetical protein
MIAGSFGLILNTFTTSRRGIVRTFELPTISSIVQCDQFRVFLDVFFRQSTDKILCCLADCDNKSPKHKETDGEENRCAKASVGRQSDNQQGIPK